MFVYDFPLSPKARTYLKLEDLFNRIKSCEGVKNEPETLCLIRAIIDFMSLIDGTGALKIDLGKDLDKLSGLLRIWIEHEEADKLLIKELADQVKEAQQALSKFTRQRTVLQNDPIIEAVKTRFMAPSGVNCFDTPLFTFWNSLSPEEKLEDVRRWLHELECIRIPITCIMNLWRISSDYQQRLAVNGFMQEVSEPCELIEIKYPKHVRGYPVVSGFQSNINVRFHPFVKGAQVGDITFELAYVRGGIQL